MHPLHSFSCPFTDRNCNNSNHMDGNNIIILIFLKSTTDVEQLYTTEELIILYSLCVMREQHH